MRVIAGKAKGTKLKTIAQMSTRPTLDYVKEAVFNMITMHIYEATVADFFAGSGSLCIEALSRGAEKAFFIEQNPKAIEIIDKNIKKTHFEEQAIIIQGDFESSAQKLAKMHEKIDILFLDPPHFSEYATRAISLVQELDLLNLDAIVIIEHNSRENFQVVYGDLIRFKEKKYAKTSISMYRRNHE